MPDPSPARFLRLDDVAEELTITYSQAYALVRRRELPAIQVGGRGQWRVERVKLGEYIARLDEESDTGEPYGL
jgi:excisionase family DNA binding protein